MKPTGRKLYWPFCLINLFEFSPCCFEKIIYWGAFLWFPFAEWMCKEKKQDFCLSFAEKDNKQFHGYPSGDYSFGIISCNNNFHYDLFLPLSPSKGKWMAIIAQHQGNFFIIIFHEHNFLLHGIDDEHARELTYVFWGMHIKVYTIYSNIVEKIYSHRDWLIVENNFA